MKNDNNKESTEILVSAITSTYNSERFIRGCLQDLVDQTLYKTGNLEIIVIDSCSQENERSIVEEFQRHYKNIVYIRTKEREPLYAAWNRGIKIAKGKYITNANTDDRHKNDALEIMAMELENNPDVALVYGDIIITRTENETFDNHTPFRYAKRPEYDRNLLLHKCYIGPHPLWRRSLHDEIGYFREDLETASDYEFFLRISEKYPFKHIPEFLGLYLRNNESVERRDPVKTVNEDVEIKKYYLKRAGVTTPTKSCKKTFAHSFFRAGKICLKKGDRKQALECFSTALKYITFNRKGLKIIKFYILTRIQQALDKIKIQRLP